MSHSLEYPSAFILDAYGQPTPRVDLERMHQLVGQQAIRSGTHPNGELTIYNYNSRYMERHDFDVDPLVSVSRGLILDQEGNVIARSFPQLTELADGQEPPEGPRTITEKVDGTMLVQYGHDRGELQAATRTSFDARHAVAGTELLQQYRDYPFDPNLTYIWEMVHPDLRDNLIVDYGNRKDITLLGSIATATGIEQPLPDQADVPFPVVKTFEGPEFESARSMRKLDWPNSEGFIVRMDGTGSRYKVKFPAFKWATMLKRGTVDDHLHDTVRGGASLQAIAKKVPGSIREQVAPHIQNLRNELDQSMDPIYAALRGEEVELTPQQKQVLSAMRIAGESAAAQQLIVPPRKRR